MLTYGKVRLNKSSNSVSRSFSHLRDFYPMSANLPSSDSLIRHCMESSPTITWPWSHVSLSIISASLTISRAQSYLSAVEGGQFKHHAKDQTDHTVLNIMRDAQHIYSGSSAVFPRKKGPGCVLGWLMELRRYLFCLWRAMRKALAYG